MEDKLITFKTAKLAKEKSFDFSERYYNYDGKIEPIIGLVSCAYPAPTQSLLQRWLREKHNIHFYIWFNELTKKFRIESNYPEYKLDTDEEFDTYENALESGLQEALKLI